MAFALAARIGVVAMDGPGRRFSHLITFDSSGVGSNESLFIVIQPQIFVFWAFQQTLYYINNLCVGYQIILFMLSMTSYKKILI